MIRGLYACPDCFTLLVDPGHQPNPWGKPCGCFACWHYGLFATEAGRTSRAVWAGNGKAVCEVYAEMAQATDRAPAQTGGALRFAG